MYDNLSDTEFTEATESDNENDKLDVFIFNESNKIIDLHNDLKNRFPYFLGNTSIPLYNFILNHIFYKVKKLKSDDKKIEYHLFNFINEYYKEIQVTLNVVNNYLLNQKKSLKCKYSDIELKDWQVFCYENF